LPVKIIDHTMKTNLYVTDGYSFFAGHLAGAVQRSQRFQRSQRSKRAAGAFGSWTLNAAKPNGLNPLQK